MLLLLDADIELFLFIAAKELFYRLPEQNRLCYLQFLGDLVELVDLPLVEVSSHRYLLFGSHIFNHIYIYLKSNITISLTLEYFDINRVDVNTFFDLAELSCQGAMI